MLPPALCFCWLRLQLRDPPPRGIVSPQQQQQQQQQQQVLQPPPPLQHLQQPDQQQQEGQQQLPQLQQQHQQQQRRRPYLQQQSLRDKNLSFSGALRGTKTLSDMLQLLENPQWGDALGDLDAVSVVGALVWLVKSSEWQQLQQEGSVGQQQWKVKRQCLACIQVNKRQGLWLGFVIGRVGVGGCLVGLEGAGWRERVGGVAGEIGQLLADHRLGNQHREEWWVSGSDYRAVSIGEYLQGVSITSAAGGGPQSEASPVKYALFNLGHVPAVGCTKHSCDGCC